jgi:hypothetical protein
VGGYASCRESGRETNTKRVRKTGKTAGNGTGRAQGLLDQGRAAGVSRDTERKKLWHISKTDESMKKIFGKMLQNDSLFEKNCQK